jgi:mono/diheme cytochrome c family protein
MRKYFALIAIIGLVCSAAYFMACNNKKSEPKADNKEDSIKKVLARGEYLVLHVTPCLDCHSKRDFTKFSGPIMPGSEGMGGYLFDKKLAGLPGNIYAKNITPDEETGIGTWTDDELYRAITKGINKKGDTLFPIMPYANFSHMAKSDIMSIIAYIRTLKPIKNKVPDRQLFIPISMAYPVPAIQPSQDGNTIPPESDAVHYGQYLVNAAACFDCHTPMNEKGYMMDRMFSGGMRFDAGSFVVNTANITPDSATGIGNWNEARFPG